MDPIDGVFIDRAALSRVFADPRTLLAFENIQRTVLETTPGAVDAAAADAAAAQASADAAQTDVNTIAGAALVVLALTGALTNERVLTGDTGVTLDVSVPFIVKIVVNALAILNSAPVILTQPLQATTITATSGLEAASLRVNETVSATATLSDASIPINIGGVVYYMRLSTAP